MSNTETRKYQDIFMLKLHEVIEITEPPYFRVMRVATGWMYNFYDGEKDTYRPEWVFVINPNVLITN